MSSGPSTPKRPCGPHVELAANPAARVTRCACGTVHVSVERNGVTLKLDAETLRFLANALGAAARVVDVGMAPPAPPTDSTFH